MRVLITGAAGNLGSRLARHLLQTTDHRLNLMIHRTPLPHDLHAGIRVTAFQCDLEKAQGLDGVCADSDCIAHFAGVPTGLMESQSASMPGLGLRRNNIFFPKSKRARSRRYR